MKTTQRRVEYQKPAPPRAHVVLIPWVATSGHPSSPYSYNNAVHAAVHSILAGMTCAKKRDVRYWLETGQRQLNDAVDCLRKRRYKVVPTPKAKRGTRLRGTA